MICRHCHTDTVEWVGPLTDLRGTRCRRCGETNCQAIEDDAEARAWADELEEDDDEDDGK